MSMTHENGVSVTYLCQKFAASSPRRVAKPKSEKFASFSCKTNKVHLQIYVTAGRDPLGLNTKLPLMFRRWQWEHAKHCM